MSKRGHEPARAAAAGANLIGAILAAERLQPMYLSVVNAKRRRKSHTICFEAWNLEASLVRCAATSRTASHSDLEIGMRGSMLMPPRAYVYAASLLNGNCTDTPPPSDTPVASERESPVSEKR